ncbi:unnamed protein product, partial [Rotaria sp. Silwood2]
NPDYEEDNHFSVGGVYSLEDRQPLTQPLSKIIT